jgi:hypothetical protein
LHFLFRRLTLYIPSAVELTRGGFFYPRGDGTYDTIISAQHILKAFADSHEKQLAGLKLLLPESAQLLQSPAAAAAVGGAAGGAVSEQRDSLRDLVYTGLSTDDNVSWGMRQKARGTGEWWAGEQSRAAGLPSCSASSIALLPATRRLVLLLLLLLSDRTLPVPCVSFCRAG